VKMISVLHRDEDPFFEFPEDVAVTIAHDRRPRGPFERLLARRPSLLLHPGDRAHDRSTLLTDLRLLRALWHAPADVVIGTRPALNLLALAARRPGTAAVGWEHMHFSIHRPAMKAQMRRSYGDLDALVVLTEGDRESFAEVLGPEARIEAIPNAVPPLPGPRAPLDEPVLLAAGRLSPQKGFDRLISAFARIADEEPDWTLRICGGGPKRSLLKKRIAEHRLKGRVVLAGRVPRLWEEMERASMFVLSSRFEGFPMVLVEAMSKGLPIVAFDCPTGPREVVRTDYNGILVPNKDGPAFARAMLELMRDPERRKRLGAGSVEVAGRYTLDRIGPRWDALLADVARRRARAPGGASVAPGRVL
jgi:glycosyltransferase involved in cell wall biosynthesis